VPLGEVDALRDTLCLPQTYFVFLGHRDDYKNAPLVFDAASRLEPGLGWGLLLVGGRPELEPEFAEKSRTVTARVARLSDAELKAAYSGAAALLYVSRYEGFGLPILEAMACDCPVITCRNSSLPEAAGDAALFVAENDPEELADAMHSVTDAAVRKDLVRRGRKRARAFTWAHTGRVAEQALREAASR